MRRMTRSLLAVAIGTGVVAAGAGGCASKTGTGALIGGLGGAAVGGAIGSAHGNAGKGALIGAGVGALGGAVVGNTMDHNDKKQEQAREDRLRREEQQRRAYDDRAASPRATAPKSSQVTVDTVINWWNDGEEEQDIIDRISRSHAVFRLTAKDEAHLRDEGVSEGVIKEMKRSGRQATAE